MASALGIGQAVGANVAVMFSVDWVVAAQADELAALFVHTVLFSEGMFPNAAAVAFEQFGSVVRLYGDVGDFAECSGQCSNTLGSGLRSCLMAAGFCCCEGCVVNATFHVWSLGGGRCRGATSPRAVLGGSLVLFYV